MAGRFDLNVTVGNEAWNLDLDADCQIGPDLDKEFREHPQKFRPWLVLHAEAQDEAARLAVDLDVLYAKLDEEKRSALLSQLPKVTERMVENEVITDDRYKELQTKLLDAKRNVLHLAAGAKVMEHRLQMLIGLGANYREEMKGDPQLRGDRQLDRMRETFRKRNE